MKKYLLSIFIMALMGCTAKEPKHLGWDDLQNTTLQKINTNIEQIEADILNK